jgi:hypothetical protein
MKFSSVFSCDAENLVTADKCLAAAVAHGGVRLE